MRRGERYRLGQLLLVPSLSDSPAGHMEILRLQLLARGELTGQEPGFLDEIFRGGYKVHRSERLVGTSPSTSPPVATRPRSSATSLHRSSAWTATTPRRRSSARARPVAHDRRMAKPR